MALDVAIYEEVEADSGATLQATAVVVLSSAAAGIGAMGLGAQPSQIPAIIVRGARDLGRLGAPDLRGGRSNPANRRHAGERRSAAQNDRVLDHTGAAACHRRDSRRSHACLHDRRALAPRDDGVRREARARLHEHCAGRRRLRLRVDACRLWSRLVSACFSVLPFPEPGAETEHRSRIGDREPARSPDAPDPCSPSDPSPDPRP